MNDPPGNFEFKEIDPEGLETLRVISDAKRFNDWMYSSIKDFCSGNILEVGSGIGNISERFLKINADLTVSDIRTNYLQFLTLKFPQLAADGKIIDLDLIHPRFENRYNRLLNQFDTVFALNVIEHIDDDNLAISNSVKLLKPGGKLVILVPAFPWLYNELDRELYHYRRYKRKELEQLFIRNRLDLLKSFYFNAAGIPGWFISGRLQKNKTIPKGQMGFFNTLVPLFRLADRILLNSFGLSVICVGCKKNKDQV